MPLLVWTSLCVLRLLMYLKSLKQISHWNPCPFVPEESIQILKELSTSFLCTIFPCDFKLHKYLNRLSQKLHLWGFSVWEERMKPVTDWTCSLCFVKFSICGSRGFLVSLAPFKFLDMPWNCEGILDLQEMEPFSLTSISPCSYFSAGSLAVMHFLILWLGLLKKVK